MLSVTSPWWHARYAREVCPIEKLQLSSIAFAVGQEGGGHVAWPGMHLRSQSLQNNTVQKLVLPLNRTTHADGMFAWDAVVQLLAYLATRIWNAM